MPKNSVFKSSTFKSFSIKLEEGDLEKISKYAIEGNVSQWIRLVVKKELEALENGDKK